VVGIKYNMIRGSFERALIIFIAYMAGTFQQDSLLVSVLFLFVSIILSATFYVLKKMVI